MKDCHKKRINTNLVERQAKEKLTKIAKVNQSVISCLFQIPKMTSAGTICLRTKRTIM